MRLLERVRMNRSLIIKGLASLGLVAGLSVVAAAPASADPYWHHGIYGPRLYPSAYRYYPRPYVYIAPAPVYYAPPPVYYAPPPVYYPAPVYYAPRPFIGVGIGLPPLVFRIH